MVRQLHQKMKKMQTHQILVQLLPGQTRIVQVMERAVGALIWLHWPRSALSERAWPVQAVPKLPVSVADSLPVLLGLAVSFSWVLKRLMIVHRWGVGVEPRTRRRKMGVRRSWMMRIAERARYSNLLNVTPTCCLCLGVEHFARLESWQVGN